MFEYEILKEENWHALVRHIDTGHYLVIGIDRAKRQVWSIMPRDNPKNNGYWVANLCDNGISYVANFYSKSYAYRKFREFVKQ